MTLTVQIKSEGYLLTSDESIMDLCYAMASAILGQKRRHENSIPDRDAGN